MGVALLCSVDALCQAFEGPFIHRPLTTGRRHRGRASPLCWSERRTRLLGFCQSQYRMCQACYPHPVCRHRSGLSSVRRLWTRGRVRAFGAYSIMCLSRSRPRQASAPVLGLSTRRRRRYGGPKAGAGKRIRLVGIRSVSLPSPHGATVRPVGFSASSGLGSSRIQVHCSTGRSPQITSRITNPYPVWQAACFLHSSPLEAIFFASGAANAKRSSTSS